MSHTYDCRRCGKASIALAHLRSHKTRLCSPVQNVIPDGFPEDGEVGSGDGHAVASGTHVPIATGHVTVEPAADAAVQTEAMEGTAPTCLSAEAEAHLTGSIADGSGDLPIEYGGIDDYIEILCLLDDQHRVATDIFNFYDNLDHHSKAVVAKSTHTLFDAHRQCEPLWDFLQSCALLAFSKAQVMELYFLFKTQQAHLPVMYRYISHNVLELQHMHGALRAIRDYKKFEEGWRRAFINLNDLHAHLKLDIPIN